MVDGEFDSIDFDRYNFIVTQRSIESRDFYSEIGTWANKLEELCVRISSKSFAYSLT